MPKKKLSSIGRGTLTPDGKKRGGDYHHGDLRQTLIAQALRALDSQTPREVSLRELARAAEVSPRAPYRHFATKESLFAAVAAEGLRVYHKRLLTEIEQAGPETVSKILAAGSAYVAFAVEHPGYFRIIYSSHQTVEEDSPELIEARGAVHGVLVALIRQAQESGKIRLEDPKNLAFAAWAIMHGVAVLAVEDQVLRFGEQVEARKLAALAGRLLLEGLTAR